MIRKRSLKEGKNILHICIRKGLPLNVLCLGGEVLETSGAVLRYMGIEPDASVFVRHCLLIQTILPFRRVVAVAKATNIQN